MGFRRTARDREGRPNAAARWRLAELAEIARHRGSRTGPGNVPIHALLVHLIDEGVKPAVLESMLFVPRCAAIYESFFQKLERNWDTVMERMDDYLATLPERLAHLR